MKTSYLILSWLTACQKEQNCESPNSLTSEVKTENLHLIAKTLACAMKQSYPLRKLIHNEVHKKFDFQPDVLYLAIKDKSIGKNTVNEYLKQFSRHLASEKNLEAAIHSLHYLQFSVPVHLDKWNPQNPIPVCVLPAGWAKWIKKFLIYDYKQF
ncbi:MAG: hypothetical protein N2662_00135 [Bacteroidales bacterium]|nr:hypothetical protein [Bacteroidales bacterium]